MVVIKVLRKLKKNKNEIIRRNAKSIAKQINKKLNAISNEMIKKTA